MRDSSLSSSVDHLTMNLVVVAVVVVECIYKRYVFSHSVAMSSAERIAIAASPSSLDCGQLTLSHIVLHLP